MDKLDSFIEFLEQEVSLAKKKLETVTNAEQRALFSVSIHLTEAYLIKARQINLLVL